MRLNTRLRPGRKYSLHHQGRRGAAPARRAGDPDFIANAGGVICAAIEYQKGTQRAAFDYIDEQVRTNTRIVLDDATRNRVLPRAAAQALAEQRVRATAATRRWR